MNVVCTPNSYIKALTFIGTGSGNGALECYLDEVLRLDGLGVLIGWGNWERAHVVKHLGFTEGCKFPGFVYKSSVVACARDTRLVGSRWLSRVHQVVNLHTLGNSR